MENQAGIHHRMTITLYILDNVQNRICALNNNIVMTTAWRALRTFSGTCMGSSRSPRRTSLRGWTGADSATRGCLPALYARRRAGGGRRGGGQRGQNAGCEDNISLSGRSIRPGQQPEWIGQAAVVKSRGCDQILLLLLHPPEGWDEGEAESNGSSVWSVLRIRAAAGGDEPR